MRLDPEIKKQVEAVLKKPVPPPTDPEFDELLLQLRKENPELAELLESGVIFDDYPAPEEETKQKVARREGFRLLLHRLLDRYDELTGEWVPSRPKRVLVGFLILIAFITVWFKLSNAEVKSAEGGSTPPTASASQEGGYPGGSSNIPQEEGKAGEEPSPPPPPLPQEESSTEGRQEEAQGGGQGEGEVGGVPTPPPPTAEGQAPPPPPPPPPGYTGTTPPPGRSAPYTNARPGEPPLTLYTASRGGGGLGLQTSSPSPAPSSSGSSDSGASSSSRPSTSLAPLTLKAVGRPSGSLTLSSPASSSQEVGPAQARTRSSTPQYEGSGRSVAEDMADLLEGRIPATTRKGGGTGSPQGEAEGLTQAQRTESSFFLRTQREKEGSFYLIGGPQKEADTPVGAFPPGEYQGNVPVQTPYAGTPLPPPSPTPPTLGTGFPSRTSSPPLPPLAPPSPYTPGTRLKGRLGIGILTAEGVSTPVAIDAEDGSTWVGEATLDETRRLRVNLSKVIKDGQEYTVSAVVLDKEGVLGLPAEVREEAPSIAADLIRGMLRGVSDYVKVASQAKSVTVLPGGGVAQSSQTPPLELFMAGSLADLFSLKQDQKAVVRVAEAKKGTEVVILVVPGGAQAPTPGKR